jgi:HSP20 family protein
MDINIKKLNPWNWFSREEDQARNVQLQRGGPPNHNPLTQLHQDIDKMFGTIFPGVGWGRMLDIDDGLLRPNVDVASTDKEYTITVEVPGVDEKDVKLELTHDGHLIVRGDKKQEKEQKDKNFYRVERSYGSFQRILSLPEDAAKDIIDASFKNGVLTITCPRKAIAQTPAKRIEIKNAA